jgi:hypothetical protein
MERRRIRRNKFPRRMRRGAYPTCVVNRGPERENFLILRLTALCLMASPLSCPSRAPISREGSPPPRTKLFTPHTRGPNNTRAQPTDWALLRLWLSKRPRVEQREFQEAPHTNRPRPYSPAQLPKATRVKDDSGGKAHLILTPTKT